MIAEASELDRLRRLCTALRRMDQAVDAARTRDDLFRRVCAVLVAEAGVHARRRGAFREEEIALVEEAARGLSLALDRLADDEARPMRSGARCAKRSRRREWPAPVRGRA